MRTASVIFEWAICVYCFASVVLFFPGSANGQERRPIRLPSENELTVSAIMYVGNLQLTEGEMPKWTKDKAPFNPHHFEYRMAMYPYVVMDNGEFAIVSLDGLHNDALMLAVALKRPPSESVRGTLVVPNANYQKMVMLRFEIPTTSFAPDAFNVRADRPVNLSDLILRHYQGTEIGMSLESQPGVSWYRMRSDVRSTAPRRKIDSDPTTFAYNFMDLEFDADISLFPRAQSVYYFNLDLFLGRKFTASPKSTMTKTLFSNPDEPRIQAWRNLLLLNELRRQFPQRDPVETYKQLTGRNVASVPGGHYQWNEHWQSMECSILGCPGSSPPSSTLLQI